MVVLRYEPDVGIAFHCDTHSFFEEELPVISIGSPIVLEFRQDDKYMSQRKTYSESLVFLDITLIFMSAI